jgi:hypothetical protein
MDTLLYALGIFGIIIGIFVGVVAVIYGLVEGMMWIHYSFGFVWVIVAIVLLIFIACLIIAYFDLH